MYQQVTDRPMKVFAAVLQISKWMVLGGVSMASRREAFPPWFNKTWLARYGHQISYLKSWQIIAKFYITSTELLDANDKVFVLDPSPGRLDTVPSPGTWLAKRGRKLP
jgi:hypothetical protein